MRNVMILAAGKGTRMQSKKNKLVHKILGKEVVNYTVDLAKEVAQNIVAIVNDDDEETKKSIHGVKFAYQRERLGTANAVSSGLDLIEEGMLLILAGDTPCFKLETINGMLEYHRDNGSDLTVLGCEMEDPTGYGRLILENNQLVRIVEHRDANEQERKVKLINTGVMLFDVKKLKQHISEIKNNNAQKEYYLTDIIEIFNSYKYKVLSYITDDFNQTVGINSREQLSQAQEILLDRIRKHWLNKGVTMVMPHTIYIEPTVELSRDCIIEQGAILRGNTLIEEDVVIGAYSEIIDSKISNGTTIERSVIKNSTIGKNNIIGPYAYIRPNTTTMDSVKIGDFVELKNATIGSKTKVPHLSYVGDADLDESINVGCGTIFVNYDGVNKHRSHVGKNSFIGCNTNIISPVNLEEDTFIAAGTTITKDVPKGSLAIDKNNVVYKEDGYYHIKGKKDV